MPFMTTGPDVAEVAVELAVSDLEVALLAARAIPTVAPFSDAPPPAPPAVRMTVTSATGREATSNGRRRRRSAAESEAVNFRGVPEPPRDVFWRGCVGAPRDAGFVTENAEHKTSRTIYFPFPLSIDESI